MKRMVVPALAALLAAGCVSMEGVHEPPTKLPEIRPGYVAGYLEPGELPDSVALLPAPPAADSAAFKADQEFHAETRKWRDTPRWTQATADAELRFPQAEAHFATALGITISEQGTPHLDMLLRRVRMDASRATDAAKDRYKRPRPFMSTGESICTPAEQSRYKADSYPSGHSSIGWAWALVLAELAPDRANAILERGIDYGTSRVICAVHWRSDIEAGRTIGAATVSRLHANSVFTTQMAFARKEIEKARGK